MHIDELRTFVEVADTLGVSPAARRLGVAKSVVSRRLFRLEADLGVQLLSRTTRGAVLTEAGAAFRDHAARICAEVDTARETIAPQGELQGRLRVAAPLTFGPTHYAPALAEMARRHPKLTLQTCYSDRFVDLVAEGFDCAIRVGYLQDSTLIARRFGSVYGKLVASPDYIRLHGAPQAPDDIMDHEALMQGSETWQFIDGDRTVSIRPRGRFKADNGTALVSAALAGLGLAWLPDDFTAPRGGRQTCGGDAAVSGAAGRGLRPQAARPASVPQDSRLDRVAHRDVRLALKGRTAGANSSRAV
ncbi:LysR family transcriptional regulator [Brevundimonas albigilva]|uniref:LysR family transcriptional regulator n=1 Tax=Brevundimonas albigilva TaxID=1312364 RepID=UPI00201B705E|nr:LysR family transcriptional regulator [Brevundimonas albigilva]UQV18565.1 LysR family transcriptional regulator [Brevundimonas albigilva]